MSAVERELHLHIEPGSRAFRIRVPSVDLTRVVDLEKATAANVPVLEATAQLPFPGPERALSFGVALAEVLFGEDRARVEQELAVPAGRVLQVVLHLEGRGWEVPVEFLALEDPDSPEPRRTFWADQACRFVRHVDTTNATPAPLRAPGAGWTVLLARASTYEHEVSSEHLPRLVQAMNHSGLTQHTRWQATRADLEREIPNHDVFHFLGHGQPNRLLLGDEDGDVDPVDADQLAAWLMQPNPAGATRALVVFGACHSATQTDGTLGLARTLVGRTGLPVLAMQGRVGQEASTGFLEAFYTELRVQDDDRVFYDIAHAAHVARSMIPPEHRGIPVLVGHVRPETPQTPDLTDPCDWRRLALVCLPLVGLLIVSTLDVPVLGVAHALLPASRRWMIVGAGVALIPTVAAMTCAWFEVRRRALPVAVLVCLLATLAVDSRSVYRSHTVGPIAVGLFPRSAACTMCDPADSTAACLPKTTDDPERIEACWGSLNLTVTGLLHVLSFAALFWTVGATVGTLIRPTSGGRPP